MSVEIRLREHRPSPATLTDAQADAVRRRLAGRIEIWPAAERGRYVLTPRAYAGIVQLPDGCTLVVEPKIEIAALFALLAEVHGLAARAFTPEAYAYTTVEAFFEFLVDFYLREVEALIARGVLCGYRSVVAELPVVRGRLLVPEMLRRATGLQPTPWCEYSRFTPDLPENRVLRWTAHCLLGYRYRDASLAAGLRRVVGALSAVALDPDARARLDEVDFHRGNEAYRPALALARLLLDRLSVGGAPGTEPFFAYLVDMNRLFERYVGAVLRRELAGADLRLVEQEHGFLDAGRAVAVRPDFVLYRAGTQVLVVDAKYKLEEHGEDLYQVVAYCHALDLDRAVLVYPAGEGAPAGAVAVRGPGDLSVQYLALDLSGGPAALQGQAREFAHKVAALAG